MKTALVAMPQFCQSHVKSALPIVRTIDVIEDAQGADADLSQRPQRQLLHFITGDQIRAFEIRLVGMTRFLDESAPVDGRMVSAVDRPLMEPLIDPRRRRVDVLEMAEHRAVGKRLPHLLVGAIAVMTIEPNLLSFQVARQE